MREAVVELYIQGRGPRHSFKARLAGWEENRLDVEGIMSSYKLKALYAFSRTDGRGHRLLFNPRNGLSHIAYSGNPEVVIRLDGDPADSYLLILAKIMLGVALSVLLAFFAVSDSLPEAVVRLRKSGSSHIAVLACFITMLYTQLIRKPSRNKRYVRSDLNLKE